MTPSSLDHDLPLRDDIRLFGRLLGETVRDQEGDATFAVIERIRQASVHLNQEPAAQAGSQHEAQREALDELLNTLPRDIMISVVRAFSYFLHLANIAEDQHHIRQQRDTALTHDAPQEGSVRHALDRIEAAGIAPEKVRDFFASALVAPVLTAHPTEISRKCILQSHHEIAALLDRRDRNTLTPDESEENETELRSAVLRLWRTRMLRPNRLAVVDEIRNGISYFDDTFLRELPRLYAQLHDHLARRFPETKWELPPFFRIGSWIGGDRDGNPFVTADILRTALRLQSTAVLDFYLEEVHTLGSELSLSRTLLKVTPELEALAASSPDNSPHRVDEPSPPPNSASSPLPSSPASSAPSSSASPAGTPHPDPPGRCLSDDRTQLPSSSPHAPSRSASTPPLSSAKEHR